MQDMRIPRLTLSDHLAMAVGGLIGIVVKILWVFR
jgi:hypothetical protein